MNIREYINYLLCIAIHLLPFYASQKKASKNILIIRLDAIGDYILFRNFIEIVKKSSEYKDYKLTLVGNVLWKPLSKELDSQFVDEFIWIDTARFHQDVFYRLKKLRELNKIGYEVVINPTYSRTLDGDFIVQSVSAKKKVGSRGDLSNIRPWQKKITDKFYTHLLKAQKGILFEFFRNKEFFEQFLDCSIPLKRPVIKLNNIKSTIKLPEKSAILFIGARDEFRQWPLDNYVKVGRFLKNKFGYEVVLCGGPGDRRLAEEFSGLSDYEYLDYVGKTGLVEFLYLLSQGDILVSNETAAPHMAAAVGVRNIFVISNGNHFGRFTPYPREMGVGYYPIYHPEIERNLEDFQGLCARFGKGSSLDIGAISAQRVIGEIDKVLN